MLNKSSKSHMATLVPEFSKAHRSFNNNIELCFDVPFCSGVESADV